MRRGRHKNETPSVRFSLGEGKVNLGQDKEMDALYYRIKSLPPGTNVFRTVCAWLITGARMESLLPQEDIEQIKQAAEDIIDHFVD